MVIRGCTYHWTIHPKPAALIVEPYSDWSRRRALAINNDGFCLNDSALAVHPISVVTSPAPAPLNGVYRYIQQTSVAFEDVCFDIEALSTRGFLQGIAKAGRGNTAFFTLRDEPLVLRHYHRGGLVQRLSKTHYVYTGLHRTRAFLEFDLLLYLHKADLPAPRPYACRVLRHGPFYSASLVTYRLNGKTLAEFMLADESDFADQNQSNRVWLNIGQTIARFHTAGVYHADLNAHNIMVDDKGAVALIDFDRGRLRALPSAPVSTGWCLDNIERLKRSVDKIAASSAADESVEIQITDGFSLCKKAWAESLAKI